MCAPPAERFDAYCPHPRIALATRLAKRAQTFRLALKGTGREKKMGTIFSTTACNQMQQLLTGKIVLLPARKETIKHNSATKLSHSSLYRAWRRFPLLDHALSSAWPYLALSASHSLAFLCLVRLALRCFASPCVASVCNALPCFALRGHPLPCFAQACLHPPVDAHPERPQSPLS